MHRIFSIQELLCFIFDELGTSSQVSCALVCKAWCEVVLARLWRVQDSPEPLVALLSKSRKNTRNDRLDFWAPLRCLDWVAFSKYAYRVRHLVIDLGSSKLGSPICTDILRERDTISLLPNLSTLKVIFHRVDHEQSIIFAGPSVKKFHLVLPEYDASLLARHFEDYAFVMPNLSVLEIDSLEADLSMESIQYELANWISALERLEHFICAPYFTTSSIVSALLRLPALRTITIDSTRFNGSGQLPDVMPFHASPPFNALDTLQTLSFCATFEDASKLLGTVCTPRLKKIVIGAPQVETAESLHKFLSVLSEKHSNIEELALDSAHFVRRPSRRHFDKDDEELDRVTFRVLKPLQELTELRSLTLSYHRQFQLTDTDLGRLIANFRDLSTLDFCAEPLSVEKPIITSGVLPIIANHCPRISFLALYMNTHISLPSPPSLINGHRVRFPYIKQIRFGTSPIAEADVSGFAFYLSKFLPSSCKVDALADVCWINHHGISRFGFSFDEATVRRWSHVSCLLEVLAKAWEEEDMHSQLLSLRTETLEARVSVLEEEKRRQTKSLQLEYLW